MLQRTRARNVVPVYEQFCREYDQPGDLARAQVLEIEALIYPLGLRWRAPLIRDLAGRLAELKDVPSDYDQLRTLPGVGDYVASAWLSLHAGKRATIVDANIVRWLCRMAGVERDGETRREQWIHKTAERLTPPRAFLKYNYAVLDFTMNICGARPKCDICPLGKRYCAFARAAVMGNS